MALYKTGLDSGQTIHTLTCMLSWYDLPRQIL